MYFDNKFSSLKAKDIVPLDDLAQAMNLNLETEIPNNKPIKYYIILSKSAIALLFDEYIYILASLH